MSHTTERTAHGVLVLLLALIGMSLAVPTAEGDSPHVSGCLSHIDTRASHWVDDVPYVTWHGVVPRAHTVRVTATLNYWYCPNKQFPNKLKPRSISWCYTHLHSPPILFGGVKDNAYIWDGAGQNVNPGAFTLKDDWDAQKCRTQHIASHKQAWLLLGFHPRWKNWVTVKMRGPVPDWDVRMESRKHHHIKYIRPHHDIRITGWRH